MCIQCAMVAASGAAGARTWLHTRSYTWLTRKRLKRITIGICTVAFAVSSIGFSGSSARPHHPAAHAAAASVRP